MTFLENLDKKIREVMNSERFTKYNFPKSTHEIPNCPFKTFESLIENIENMNAVVIHDMEGSDFAFSTIATRYESILLYIALMTPYVVTFLVISSAFWLHNYWLLTAIIFPFLSAFFTSPYFPHVPTKTIIPYTAVLMLGIGGFRNSMPMMFFFGGYFLCHVFSKLHRDIYSVTIFKRAFALESVFILLHTLGNIILLDKNLQEFKTV